MNEETNWSVPECEEDASECDAMKQLGARASYATDARKGSNTLAVEMEGTRAGHFQSGACSLLTLRIDSKIHKAKGLTISIGISIAGAAQRT